MRSIFVLLVVLLAFAALASAQSSSSSSTGAATSSSAASSSAGASSTAAAASSSAAAATSSSAVTASSSTAAGGSSSSTTGASSTTGSASGGSVYTTLVYAFTSNCTGGYTRYETPLGCSPLSSLYTDSFAISYSGTSATCTTGGDFIRTSWSNTDCSDPQGYQHYAEPSKAVGACFNSLSNQLDFFTTKIVCGSVADYSGPPVNLLFIMSIGIDYSKQTASQNSNSRTQLATDFATALKISTSQVNIVTYSAGLDSNTATTVLVQNAPGTAHTTIALLTKGRGGASYPVLTQVTLTEAAPYKSSSFPSGSDTTPFSDDGGDDSTVTFTITFDIDYASLNKSQIADYKDQLKTEMAAAIPIASDNVDVKEFRAGSTVAVVEVTDAPAGATARVQEAQSSGKYPLLAKATKIESNGAATIAVSGMLIVALAMVAMFSF